jgi:hypothetical protein
MAIDRWPLMLEQNNSSLSIPFSSYRLHACTPCPIYRHTEEPKHGRRHDNSSIYYTDDAPADTERQPAVRPGSEYNPS